MREIEFRGKLIGKGEWAYGNLSVKHNGISIITPDETPLGKCGQVDPATVGQYVGLCDKNGVKIFEGDILKVKHGETLTTEGTVIFNGMGQFVVDCYRGKLINFETCKKCHPDKDLKGYEISLTNGYCAPHLLEIIGNIHDNPELLEGGK